MIKNNKLNIRKAKKNSNSNRVDVLVAALALENQKIIKKR